MEPAVDWLPSVPERWRNRTVWLTTINEARAVLEPRFIKSAPGKEFDARAYASGKDLPRGEMIGGSLAVLVQEIVQFDVCIEMVRAALNAPAVPAPEAGASLLGYALKTGRASGYRALYSGLEDQRVSLNTYARNVVAIMEKRP